MDTHGVTPLYQWIDHGGEPTNSILLGPSGSYIDYKID
jgi:hypothetical protein